MQLGIIDPETRRCTGEWARDVEPFASPSIHQLRQPSRYWVVSDGQLARDLKPRTLADVYRENRAGREAPKHRYVPRYQLPHMINESAGGLFDRRPGSILDEYLEWCRQRGHTPHPASIDSDHPMHAAQRERCPRPTIVDIPSATSEGAQAPIVNPKGKGVPAMSNSTRAIISAADYLFMERFASDEETRYYLNGVFVEGSADGIRLVSTDGHRLGVIKLRSWEGYFAKGGANFIAAYTAETVKWAKVNKPGFVRYLHFLDDKLSFVDVPVPVGSKSESREEADQRQRKAVEPAIAAGFADGLSRPVASIPASTIYIDGTFPEWRRLIPAKPSGQRGKNGVNVDFLASFAVDDDLPFVALVNDDGGPALVSNADPRFIGLLMPAVWKMDDDAVLAQAQAIVTVVEPKVVKAAAKPGKAEKAKPAQAPAKPNAKIVEASKPEAKPIVVPEEPAKTGDVLPPVKGDDDLEIPAALRRTPKAKAKANGKAAAA